MRTSGVLCRAMASLTSRLLDLRLRRTPKGVYRGPSTKTSRVEPRRARAVETAAGLGRRRPSGPERLPLDRPEPCSPGRQMSHSLFACAASAPHPVACCERTPPRQGPASHLRLSSLCRPRVAPRTAPNQKDASHQLLQPTPKTSTLWSVRFPSAPGEPCDLPCAEPPSANDLGQLSGGASLDGDAPASA